MVYFQFDTQNNNLKYVKIILIILLIILSMIGFIYFYNITSIINTLNIIHIKTIKGKIDNIEGNITELFNYTEEEIYKLSLVRKKDREKKSTLKCNFCKKIYSTKYTLEKHQNKCKTKNLSIFSIEFIILWKKSMY